MTMNNFCHSHYYVSVVSKTTRETSGIMNQSTVIIVILKDTYYFILSCISIVIEVSRVLSVRSLDLTDDDFEDVDGVVISGGRCVSRPHVVRTYFAGFMIGGLVYSEQVFRAIIS